MPRVVAVPERVRRRAEVEGAACVRWMDDLGDLVEGLERDWGITVGATMEGGTASLVAEAVTADGTAAVLKLAMPAQLDGRETLANEVRTLRLADGRGCVRVWRDDAERGAALLERLGRQLDALGLPVPQQMVIICAALQQLWAVPYGDVRLPTLADKGRLLAQLIADLWEELDRPCSARVVEAAVACAERGAAAFDPDRAALVHGDAHAWNTLEDPLIAPSGFRLVDADGLIAEPEYDLAILMREFTDELVAGDALRIGQERARFLADHTGLDEQKIWEWGYVERVSTGLLCLQLGFSEPARDFLAVAEQWSAAF